MWNPKLLPNTGVSTISETAQTPDVAPQVAPQISQQPVASSQPVKADIGKVYKLRKKLLSVAKNGEIPIDVAKVTIDKSGIKDPSVVETLVGTTLSDNIIRYFLSATNNNPKKAKALASKFGYKV